MAGTAIEEFALLMWGPRSTITTLSWYDGDPVALREVLGAVESETTSELVAGDGGTYAFVRQKRYGFDDDLLELVTDAGVVFLPPITFHESGEATFEAVGTTPLLSAFHETLRQRLETRIDRVTDFHRHGTGAALTERQRTALAAARAAGYYEIPRTGSVADVAESLDCSSSTAGELLRRAEAALVEAHASNR